MNARLLRILSLAVSWYALSPVSARAQSAQPTTLIIDVSDLVEYVVDVEDPNKFGRQTGIVPTTSPGGVPRVAVISDITTVNGQPAKGNILGSITAFGARPNLTPGFAIADITRTVMSNLHIEIQRPDGTPIGTLFAAGTHGAAPPGAPSLQSSLNFAITGGTGAFLGARGTFGGVTRPGARTGRVASIAEDTAYRRINGGGQRRYILVFYPQFTPKINEVDGRPAITHADFAPVSVVRPAAPGEALTLFVTGLGPTSPGLDPGQTFPKDPLSTVTSPIEVTVAGIPCTVTAAVGFPGSADGYQVNFELPPGLSSGTAELKLSAAWSNAPPVRIPIR